MNEIFTVTLELLQTLKEKEIGLDEYLVLLCKSKANKVLVKYRPDSSVYQSLYEKGYLTTTKSISAHGRLIVMEITTGKNLDLKHLKTKFNEFWKAYPDSTAVLNFAATPRQMKPPSQKAACFNIFCEIAIEDDIEHVIQGVKNEIILRTVESRRTRKNEMKWMKGPLNWLRDRDYIAMNKLNTDGESPSHTLYGKDVE